MAHGGVATLCYSGIQVTILSAPALAAPALAAPAWAAPALAAPALTAPALAAPALAAPALAAPALGASWGPHGPPGGSPGGLFGPLGGVLGSSWVGGLLGPSWEALGEFPRLIPTPLRNHHFWLKLSPLPYKILTFRNCPHSLTESSLLGQIVPAFTSDCPHSLTEC